MASERASMASERAADVTSAEATADWIDANCDSRDSTRAPKRAEVEGAESRTSKPMATGAGSTKQSGSDRPFKARARTNPITRLCRNWPATESGWPGLSRCQSTSRISGKAVISAGTMGAISVNRSARGPLSSGRPRTERIRSVGWKMV